jgi:hypothetical protein
VTHKGLRLGRVPELDFGAITGRPSAVIVAAISALFGFVSRFTRLTICENTVLAESSALLSPVFVRS